MNFEITEKALDPSEMMELVADRNAGAITLFVGTVREMTKEKKTLYLVYEVYKQMAEKKLAQIGSEIEKNWPNTKVAIKHRVGKLEISDTAVIIAISSPHRNDAYEANRYAIERIKEIVPIWKKEHWENGEEWVGDQLETVAYPSGRPE